MKARPFITLWRTTQENESITIPVNYKYIHNYTVDWGDKTITTNHKGDATHTYKKIGLHIIKITGLFSCICFDYSKENHKIIDVKQWGDIVWVSMRNAFAGCENLNISATDKPNLSRVKDMSFMFYKALLFNGDISNWDVSNVTNMSYMFWKASSFNQDISKWDVSNVRYMSYVFWKASSFNGDISNWDVSKVIDMSYMFLDALIKEEYKPTNN